MRESIALPGSAKCRGFEGTPPVVAVSIDLIERCQPPHILLHIGLEAGKRRIIKIPVNTLASLLMVARYSSSEGPALG